MRTIKHRGKTEDGIWVFGSFINTMCGDKALIIGRQALQTVIYEVSKETIGQFTGLLDKNDREIYEDDIVRDSEGRISYVKWLIQRCGFVLVYEQFDKDITGSYGKTEHLEVIGNLHDNKELIKEK